MAFKRWCSLRFTPSWEETEGYIKYYRREIERISRFSNAKYIKEYGLYKFVHKHDETWKYVKNRYIINIFVGDLLVGQISYSKNKKRIVQIGNAYILKEHSRNGIYNYIIEILRKDSTVHSCSTLSIRAEKFWQKKKARKIGSKKNENKRYSLKRLRKR